MSRNCIITRFSSVNVHYIPFYDVVDNFIQRRDQFRRAHLALAKEGEANGDLVMTGALSEPVDRAVLIFTSREAAEEFAKSDPYYSNGLVRSYAIRKWNAVIGPGVESK